MGLKQLVLLCGEVEDEEEWGKTEEREGGGEREREGGRGREREGGREGGIKREGGRKRERAEEKGVSVCVWGGEWVGGGGGARTLSCV